MRSSKELGQKINNHQLLNHSKNLFSPIVTPNDFKQNRYAFQNSY